MDSAIISLLTSERFLVSSTIVFVTTALAVRSYTIRHGPIPGAGELIKMNSYFYSCCSLLLLMLILRSMLPTNEPFTTFSALNIDKIMIDIPHGILIRSVHGLRVNAARFTYHLSKFYEYCDIILVLGVHGTQPLSSQSSKTNSKEPPTSTAEYKNPIDLHFAIHHLTTPYLTYFRVIKDPCFGWEIFAGLNAMHHVVMYAFFGGAFGSEWLRKALRDTLPWTGFAQLIVGIALELYSLRYNISGSGLPCPESSGLGHYVSLVLLFTYLVLYIRDLRLRAQPSDDSKPGK